MANIKVTLDLPIVDGQPLTFKAPCDCTAVTGLAVYYPDGESTTSKVFTFSDAHGNDLTGVGNLFAAGAYVKVLLGITNSVAYIQNADTNKYLEGALASKYSPNNKPAASDVGLGNVPNVSTNNQTPTYSQAGSLANLTSGEKLSVSMGKIMKAISDLISHLSNKNNPHGITASQISAVPTSRTVNGKALSSNISLTATDVGASQTGHVHGGDIILPSSIELYPGAGEVHGGWVDFHYGESHANYNESGAVDFSARIIEATKGNLHFTNASGSYRLLTEGHFIALYSVPISFTNGIGTYSHSAIKANTMCLVQRRAGVVGYDSAFTTMPSNGKLTIAGPSNLNGDVSMNIFFTNFRDL